MSDELNKTFRFATLGLTSIPQHGIQCPHKFELGGLKWSFMVDTTKRNGLSFSLSCDNRERPNWEFDLTGSIAVLGIDDRPAIHYEIPRTLFTRKRSKYFSKDKNGVKKVVPCLRGNDLHVRLNISLVEKRVFDVPMSATDMTVVVEDAKFYVPKAILEASSPMFVPFFCADFEEGEDVVLEGDSATDFGELFRFLQPNSEAIVTKNNVMGLLKLAFKYTFPGVLTKCEDFLIAEKAGRTAMDSNNYLNVAVEYQLLRMQRDYLSSLTLRDIRKKFASDDLDPIAKNILKKTIDQYVDGEVDNDHEEIPIKVSHEIIEWGNFLSRSFSIQVTNMSTRVLAIKIKCSDNLLYRVAPVYAMLDAKGAMKVTVVRANGPTKDDKLVVVYITAKSASEDPQELYGATDKTKQERITIKMR